MVETEYPADDIVTVLLSRPALPGGNSSVSTTPLRIRVPGWATGAKAWHNGAIMAAPNGTMLTVGCSTAHLCNVTIDLAPRIRTEQWFGSAVSVFRGPVLYAADLGRNYTRYSPACEQPPFDPSGCPDIGPGPRPAAVGWWGVTRTKPFNLALVLPNVSDPTRSLHAVVAGRTGSGWIGSVARAPVTVAARARLVTGWEMANSSDIEAAPPPGSPACSGNRSAGCSVDDVLLSLVPFASTELRVAAFPVA